MNDNDSPPPDQDTISKAQRHIDRAHWYRVWKSDFEGAFRELAEAIRLAPDFSAAYRSRAELHERQKDLAASISDWSMIIRLTPHDTEAYRKRGTLYRRLGKPEKAICDYNRAIELDLGGGGPFGGRAMALDDLGMYEEAYADMQRSWALGLFEDCPEAAQREDLVMDCIRKGNGSLKEGAYDDAVSFFSNVIYRKPDYAEARFYRAIAYKKKGQLEKSCADFARAYRARVRHDNRFKGYLAVAEYDHRSHLLRLYPDTAVGYRKVRLFMRRFLTDANLRRKYLDDEDASFRLALYECSSVDCIEHYMSCPLNKIDN